MTKITLKGREIPLTYTVFEMKAVQEEICPLGDLQYVLFGRNKEDKEDLSLYGAPEHLGAVAKMIRILGNSGLEEAGEAPDLTDKWIMRAMKPAQLNDAIAACLQAINEGMESEIHEEESGEPEDVTLEEMKKKKETES